MPITFQREKLSHVWPEVQVLLVEHWRELARNKDKIVLEPDADKYHQIEQLDMLRLYTARNEQQLVGYAVYMIAPHLHYASHVWAASDVFWLAPAFRKGSTGLRLFKFVEEQLKQDGVSVMHTVVKISHPAAGVILQYLGHSHIEHGFSKMLKTD